MPTYVMQRAGGFRGAETGQHYSVSSGDEIDAPEGELSGLPGSAYETRDMRPSDGARYKVRQSGAWWVVYDTETSEKVDGESERSKEDALENAKRLNS